MGSTVSVGAELGDGRPPSDPVAMARARARAELALFGEAEPAGIGRYEIREPIASGGMGVVFAAYDPELDRRVALKVVHPRHAFDAASRRRIITEARALARLDHPHVVKVHDVLAADGQLVIVMELIDGGTLADWESAAPRAWRDIVEVYGQAGAGLAAAHGVGVIHRDFKPTNAVIGVDGRVRVLDFGLARLGDTEPDRAAPTAPAAGTGASATIPGVFVGTLAYAAPEQLAGGEVTAAADLFAFCVALHHAVEGVPPFGGATPAERAAAIARGEISMATDGRAAPGWLRAAIRRGLAADPARRPPTMAGLVRELARPRGWRRWRPVALAALPIAVAAAIVVAARGAGSAATPCDGGSAEVAAVWSADARARVTAALAGSPAAYAAELRGVVLGALDAQAARWTDAHRAACQTHRRGAMSDAMLDRAMACLAHRLAGLGAAIDVVAGLAPAERGNAADVVAYLDDAADCAEPDRLGIAAPPPAMRTEVAAVRAQIERASALERAGRQVDAGATAGAAVAAARAATYPPALAEALLARGRIALMQGTYAEAEPPLYEAMQLGLAHGLPALAVEAAARRVFVRAVSDAPLDRALDGVELALPLADSLPGDAFARPLLLNNIGAAYLAAERTDLARAYFTRAAAARGEAAVFPVELTCIDENLAAVTGDPIARAELAGRAVDRRRAALGDHHLWTLEARVKLAQATPDPTLALAELDAACEGYRAFHPELAGAYFVCAADAAFLAQVGADPAGARDRYAAARAVADAVTLPDRDARRDLIDGQLALVAGDLAAARRAFAAAAAAKRDPVAWWDEKLLAQAELGLGLAAAPGDRATAEHLTAALSRFEALATAHVDAMYPLAIAAARAALAAVRNDPPARGTQ